MFRIMDGKFKWICEYGGCFKETKSMLRLVVLSFDWIPLEFHPRSIPRSGVRANIPPGDVGAPMGPNASVDRPGPRSTMGA